MLDGIISYPYGTSVGTVCKTELIQIITDDLKYLKMKTIKCRNYRTKMIKFENLIR